VRGRLAERADEPFVRTPLAMSSIATKKAIWPSRRASITSPSRRQILKMLCPSVTSFTSDRWRSIPALRLRNSHERRTRCRDIPPSRRDFTTRSATMSRNAYRRGTPGRPPVPWTEGFTRPI
jgi:hypothetical protein